MKKALVPIAAIVVALTFVFSMFVTGNNVSSNDATDAASADAADTGAAADAATPSGTAESASAEAEIAEPDVEVPDAAVADAPAAEPTEPVAVESTAEVAAEPASDTNTDAAELRLADPANPVSVTLGSVDPESGFELEATFSPYGAALFDLRMSGFDERVDGDEPYALVGQITTSYAGQTYAEYPYAARWVTIDGVQVDLRNAAWSLGEIEREPGSETVRRARYRVTVLDESGEPIAEVVRDWTVELGSYDIALDQRVVNLSGRALAVSFSQFLQGDVVDDGAAYLGDMRLFATGYFRPSDPNRTMV
ncbi:MAG: hypothetical protein AAF078_12940, partial [Planctomycetota bacterium]